MIRAGFTIESVLTHSRTVILKSDAETKNMGWLLEVTCAPNKPADIKEHYHLTWTERFEIISGTAFYSLDGVQHTARAGGSFAVNPGQHHIHPWSAGDTEMVYRQEDTFASADPDAVQEVLGVFATVAGLAREGKINEDGTAKNPLQLAVVLKTLIKHGGYDASVPMGVQKFVAATLGSLGEALGYKAVYPQFVQ